ncbi:MAG: ankyrin repeat domain-containing protein [Mariprofundus sp.]
MYDNDEFIARYVMTDQQAWFKAASDGDIESLKQALALGIDINVQDTAKNTALHLATKHGHQQSMLLLIEAGAELNIQNDFDSTPLHLTEKNIASIRMLLEAGADSNIRDKDWDYPYYFAFYGSMTRELTELYIKHGAHLMFVDK